jgi:DivIVA domain-containing protein
VKRLVLCWAVVDRDKIERRDFPTGRRGYDPAAVDEHLRRVADEFEAQVHPPPPSLSSGMSEQVRQILVAAERGASELRARAGEDASDHVARVQTAAGEMLAKLDGLEGELGRLLDALRTSGERLTQGLAALEADVGRGDAPGSAVRPPVEFDSVADRDLAAAADAAEEGFAAAAPAPGEHPALDGSGADEAGARLIALNMALSGSSREDTARYLADHFTVADPAALLDDVYARAGR